MSQSHVDCQNRRRMKQGLHPLEYVKPTWRHGEALDCAILYSNLGDGTKALLQELVDNIRYQLLMDKQ